MAASDLRLGPQIVANKGQIASILNRLRRQRSLLTIRLADSRREFRSAVLAVDGRQQTVMLDELHPERGHDLIANGTQLRVLSRTSGVETRFRLRVDEIGIEGGMYFYIASFPDEILYHQRRQFVRVPVRLARQRRCLLRDDSRVMEIRLNDLSAGGFGGYTLRGGEVSRGEIWRFDIDLEGVEPFSGQLEIRYASRDKVHRRLRFGAQFLDLPPVERARIERLIAILQRELLRST